MINNNLLDWAALSKRVPYTRQHCSRLERAGKFPKRLVVGDGRVAWLEREIDAWLEERLAERPGPIWRPAAPGKEGADAAAPL